MLQTPPSLAHEIARDCVDPRSYFIVGYCCLAFGLLSPVILPKGHVTLLYHIPFVTARLLLRPKMPEEKFH